MKGLLFIPELAVKACDGTKTHTRRALGNYEGVELTPSVVADLLDQCGYKSGERRCLLSAWAVAPEFDHLKPTELDPNKVSGHFWHAGQGEKPAGFGDTRYGSHLPNVLRCVLMPMFDVTDVRIERVQDITWQDSLAEGVSIARCGCEACSTTIGLCTADQGVAIEGFIQSWDSLYAPFGYGWEKNPIVAVVTFNRL